jgi:hypothetical protein
MMLYDIFSPSISVSRKLSLASMSGGTILAALSWLRSFWASMSCSFWEN